MAEAEAKPFCNLCEREHDADALCTGEDGSQYDMRLRVGGLSSIHRQPLEEMPYARS